MKEEESERKKISKYLSINSSSSSPSEEKMTSCIIIFFSSLISIWESLFFPSDHSRDQTNFTLFGHVFFGYLWSILINRSKSCQLDWSLSLLGNHSRCMEVLSEGKEDRDELWMKTNEREREKTTITMGIIVFNDIGECRWMCLINSIIVGWEKKTFNTWKMKFFFSERDTTSKSHRLFFFG